MRWSHRRNEMRMRLEDGKLSRPFGPSQDTEQLEPESVCLRRAIRARHCLVSIFNLEPKTRSLEQTDRVSRTEHDRVNELRQGIRFARHECGGKVRPRTCEPRGYRIGIVAWSGLLGSAPNEP